jgi:hypothetical protein
MFDQVFKKFNSQVRLMKIVQKCGTKRKPHHILIFSLHAKPINPNSLHFNYKYIKKPIMQLVCFMGISFLVSLTKKLGYFWNFLILMYIQLVLPIFWKILKKNDILELKKKTLIIII